MTLESKSWLPNYTSRRLTRRKFLGTTAAGAGAAALIACGGGESEPQVITIDPSGIRTPGAVVYERDAWKLADETKNAVAGGIFPDYRPDDLTSSWDPFLANVGTVDDFGDIGYDYLVGVNKAPGVEPGTLESRKVLGNLAESFEMSKDGLSYTFKMRKGVKFHPIAPVNGREMTIEDWKTSFDRFIQVGTGRVNVQGVIDKVEYPDASTMVVKMVEPYVPFLPRLTENDFGWKIVPKELNANPQLAATNMIGTNWRMVDKIQPSTSWEFKKFDQFWGGKPFIDRWRVAIVPETANARSQFLAQNIQAFTPSARDALTLKKDAPGAMMIGQAISPYDTPRGIWGKVDLATSPWKDARVRIAMRKILDYDAIFQFQSNAKAFADAGVEVEVGYTTHAPREPEYWLDPRKGELGAASSNYLHDIAAAKQLISAAGYPNGIEIDVWASHDQNVDLVGIMIDQYKKAEAASSVKVNHVVKQRQEFYDLVVYSANFKGVQATSGGAGGATDVDYVMYNNYYSKGRATAIHTPEWDKLIEAQRREHDPQKRAGLIKEWQMIVAKEFPVQPTRYYYTTWAFEWPWVHNSNILTGGERGRPSHLWWLDTSMPRRNG